MHDGNSATSGDDMLRGVWTECWQCGGEGLLARCISDYACEDAEDGCELCLHPCDICEGEGGWSSEASTEPPSYASSEQSQDDGGPIQPKERTGR